MKCLVLAAARSVFSSVTIFLMFIYYLFYKPIFPTVRYFRAVGFLFNTFFVSI
ncbi:MAG: hypothetical protein ISP01_07385 [Methanobrevibacter arboriphilus]|uniref:Uncharacterized protein n=1 Tax=Methanobrevibacter arboriphilus TaxID=39441 RepID=A0A843AET2_METAZ|nr:hypothetical protein [Methanobrevibacter arboriphilus]